MRTLRKNTERGHATHGWLDTYHTFSFADYMDPRHMGFSALRVINEDRIKGGQGFPMHPHRDMEIITLVLEGTLAHQDNMGNGSVIRPGDIQVMSAGTGVLHSEFNPSPDQETHLLQIWLLPAQKGVSPRYEQAHLPLAEQPGSWRLLVSPDGQDGSMWIHQDAHLLGAILDPGQRLTYNLKPDRRAYLQVMTGFVTLDGQPLGAGDGVRIEQETRLDLTGTRASQVLLFDLP